MPGYHLPYFTAAETGIFAEHGLEVEIVDPVPGPANARAVAAGRYEFCLTSVAHYLTAKREHDGVDAKFVLMVARRPHHAVFFLDGRPAAHGRPIQGFDDLGGVTLLGSRESPFVREYLALADRLGAQPGEVVELPYEHVMEALAAGDGDLAVDFLDLRPTFERVAAERGTVGALPLYEAGADAYGSGLVAGTWLIESRPETVRRMVAALVEALLAAREDPTPGIAPMRARFPEFDPEHAVAGWRAGDPLVFGASGALGSMDRAGWERTLAHF